MDRVKSEVNISDAVFALFFTVLPLLYAFQDFRLYSTLVRLM